MGLKNDFDSLKKQAKADYDDYKKQLAECSANYDNACRLYDGIVGTINGERLASRDEIRKLYDFLISIGGSLKDEHRITVFDFENETFAKSKVQAEISQPIIPYFEDNNLWDFVVKTGIGVVLDHYKNKGTYEVFLREVEEKKMEYDKDIADRKQVAYDVEVAAHLAKRYREIVVIVRDVIKDKIIPELELIESFLYADAIRELVVEGENISSANVELCNISEYKGTRQDVHYQFVRNAFDFYRISTDFFRKTVLTDILEDYIVTDEEVADFNKQIETIKKQVKLIEEKTVF